MKRKTFLSAVLILAAGTAIAGPFGLNKGDSLSKLKTHGLEPIGTSGLYRAKAVPNPHPQFDFYAVVATPEEGLCKIIARTDEISTSVYGSELKDRFEAIRDALEAKYGKGETYDKLRAGSIWDEPKDWMTALVKKERTLVTYWVDGTYPDGIESITLEASADDRSSGDIRLVYELDNFSACLARKKAKEAESL